MSTYISSNQNRFYCGLEAAYGVTPAVTAANRFSAVKLTARQELDLAARKDKTGSRTFPGSPAGARRKTTFDLKTYLEFVDGGQRPTWLWTSRSRCLGRESISLIRRLNRKCFK